MVFFEVRAELLLFWRFGLKESRTFVLWGFSWEWLDSGRRSSFSCHFWKHNLRHVCLNDTQMRINNRWMACRTSPKIQSTPFKYSGNLETQALLRRGTRSSLGPDIHGSPFCFHADRIASIESLIWISVCLMNLVMLMKHLWNDFREKNTILKVIHLRFKSMIKGL